MEKSYGNSHKNLGLDFICLNYIASLVVSFIHRDKKELYSNTSLYNSFILS